MTKVSLTALDKTLSPYLHQDWHLEFPDETAATLAAARSQDSPRLRGAVQEIDNMLEQSRLSESGESELGQECLNQGIYFDPTLVGLTYAEWLTRVRSAFQAELDGRRD